MTSSRGLLFSPIQSANSFRFPTGSKNVRIGDAYDLTSIDNGINIVGPAASINFSRTIVTPVNQELSVYLVGLSSNNYSTTNSSVTIDYPGGTYVVMQNSIFAPNGQLNANGIAAETTGSFQFLGDTSDILIVVYTSLPQFTINVVNVRDPPNVTPLSLRLTYTQIPVINPISNANFIGQLGAVYDSEIETPLLLSSNNTTINLSQRSYKTLGTLTSGRIIVSGQNLVIGGTAVTSPQTLFVRVREVNSIEGDNLVVTAGNPIPTVLFIVTEQLLPVGSLPTVPQGNPMTLQLNNFRPHLGNGPVTWNGFRFFRLQSGEEGIVMTNNLRF